MCKISPSQIAADGMAVNEALDAIANVEEATNPVLANELKAAGTALVTATANWKSGDSTADIEAAASAAETILDAIPETSQYATYIALAVTALDILLGVIGTQDKLTANLVKDSKLVVNHINNLPPNHWRGLVKIKRFPGEAPKTALVRAWDGQNKKQPELGMPTL